MWTLKFIRDNTFNLVKRYNEMQEPDNYITILFTHFICIREFFVLVEFIDISWVYRKKCSFSICYLKTLNIQIR